jgi:hypothetical protein
MSTVGGSWSRPKIVNDGLVLYLDASAPNSYSPYFTPTTWKDLSGNNNSGSLVNGPTFDSGNGGSIVFDGVNDYVSISNESFFDFTNNVTFDIVFSTNNTNTPFQTLFSKAEGGAYGMEIDTGLGVDSMVFLLYIDGAYKVATESMSNYTSGFFYNVVGTYNGSFIKLYRNGNEVASTPQTGQISTTNVPLFLGANPPAGGSPIYYLDGKIKSFKVYNRALTAQEVLQNYNATKGRFEL